MKTVPYVLVTPARNEVGTIGRTIEAVTRQTVQPREWVIISDGSTDGTDQVVREFSKRNGWIRLLSLPIRETASFSAVVRNTELGIEALRCRDYEYLGLLDADLDFQPDYFEVLLARFGANSRLGIAGGVVIDIGRPRNRFPRNRIEVPGAVQFFRRSCFDQLGGLIPIPEGGWDCVTCATARMRGFETQLCTDLVVDHLKPRNVSQGGPLRRLWQLGMRDYALGYDPLFELLKCFARISEPPFPGAAFTRWLGYCAAIAGRRGRVVPRDIVAFVQREQRQRIRRLGRVHVSANQH